MTLIIIFTLLAYLILVGPSIILVFALLKGHDSTAKFIVGNVAGIALITYFGYLCAFIKLNYFLCLLIPYYIIALYFYNSLKYHNNIKNSHHSPGLLFWLIAGLTFLSRLAPLLFSELPHGIDSEFHLILIKKILLTGALPNNWLPFENKTVFYPLGSHVFVAWLSALSNVPPHEAYKICFPILATLSAGMVFLIARSVTNNKVVATLSFFSYAFLANWGSLDYYRWGGLPNMLAMTITLASIWALLQQDCRGLFIAILVAAINTIHLHAAFTAYLIISVYLITAHLKQNNMLAGKILKIIIVSLLGSLIPAGHYFKKICLAGNPALFTSPYPQVNLSMVPHQIGLVLFIFAIPGLIYFFNKSKNSDRLFLWLWVFTLATLYIFFDHFLRFVLAKISGKGYGIFEPSRFIAYMAYPGSILCGAGLWQFYSYLKTKFIFFIFITLLLTYPLVIISSQCHSQLAPAEYTVFQWIKNNTPPNAVIVPYCISSDWQYYLTWREGGNKHIGLLPDTEETTIKKKTLLSFDYNKIKNWMKAYHKPVYYAGKTSMLKQAWLTEIYREDEISVFEVRIITD